MIRLKKFLLLFALFGLGAGVSSSGALAQTTQAGTAPTFTILDIGPLNLDKEQAPASLSGTKAFSDIKNTHMQTVLRLQNQITMLNALNNWQRQVTDMQIAYNKAGMPFFSPKPPRDICQEVPANTVCGEAYPELAPVPDIVSTPAAPAAAGSADILTAIANGTPPAEADAASVEDDDQAKKEKDEPPAPPPVNYEWSDLQCAASNCQAVLVDLTSGARITAKSGETLEEGVMVQSITPAGVKLTVNGETKTIRPSDKKAPAPDTRDNLTSLLKQVPGAPEEAMEPIVLDDGDGNQAGDVPLANEPSDTAPPEGEQGEETSSLPTADAPPQTSTESLGPTGLF